ncbi:peptide/nickel transport system ATP-binding protein [Loktanella atrilutea]|uniref:Peptide/nickel transport system ATP-binding protein n=1 Tax=Loktanella atrilutea TaxID=366533 RepID=A0A1M4YSS2_LOKAT|nr:ABC transporter ATP-binding protein [Loktanella atrilutea]SHF08824.1 peptide/nickel transport system ATP-binding protein [Loktanella atrilutea]
MSTGRTDRDLLRIEELNVSFSVQGGMIEALRGVSLRVLPGKVTALVGESGSGKSVLGQMVMGLQPVSAKSSGRILFSTPDAAPRDLLAMPRDGRAIRAIRGRHIGMIFQEPMTSFSALHTIGDQVAEALQVHTVKSSAERRAVTEEMLGLVGFDDPARIYRMYPFELSGGMRQRAMIAMALICGPSLLIADEPTTALDVTIQAQILTLLRDLQLRRDMGMLLITHDLGVVANVADEVVVIYRGKIMEAGPVEAIFDNPQHAYLKGLMTAIPHFDMTPGERLRPLRDIPLDRARLHGAITPVARPADANPVLLSVRGLRKTFAVKQEQWALRGKAVVARPAVDDVSFDILRGECLGLVGESGSGKTTVGKILMRGLVPDTGTVTYDDGTGPVDVLRAKGEVLQRLRKRIQMVFQDPVSSLSPRMTVGNILSEPLDIHSIGTPESRRDATAALLEAIGMDRSVRNRYPHSFSGGQRQRIGIARALTLSPGLIICDEPVSALDVSVQAQILNLLKDLQRDLGLTYLFISHNLAVVDYMADRVAVMWAGRIVEIAPREVLMRAPVHPYTRALLAAVPYPDLARPLDFGTVGQSTAEASAAWPQAFQPDTGLTPLDLGSGHHVLANPAADAAELRA